MPVLIDSKYICRVEPFVRFVNKVLSEQVVIKIIAFEKSLKSEQNMLPKFQRFRNEWAFRLSNK